MQFTDTLITWYEANKRSLPWRGETDPYKIWVSEIILQQTRVQQGWDYYMRFIDHFPTVQNLADAPEEQVLRVWQGLGYYSRARNMHFAAKQIMNEFNGSFPNHYEDIRKLKGVGDYTAAAIGSIAFNLPYPAVDGNVFRIISRIFGITDDITLPATKLKITEICNQRIDTYKPGIFNQAAMEFGAIHCTPKNPQCDVCPFQTTCYALIHHTVNILPVKSNRLVKKERYFHFFIYLFNNQTIIEKRTEKDIWQNLYQFPLIESDGKTLQGKKPRISLKEVLTHQIIYAYFYIMDNVKDYPKKKSQIIVNVSELTHYPMPKIMISGISSLEDFVRIIPR